MSGFRRYWRNVELRRLDRASAIDPPSRCGSGRPVQGAIGSLHIGAARAGSRPGRLGQKLRGVLNYYTFGVR